MNLYLVFTILATMIILLTNYDPVFATHMGSHHDAQMGEKGMMGKQMMGNITGHHHMSFKGMCAPGFASLDGRCVLDDRCGPGAYPGKVCMMDGMMKQYLRPHHQKFAGISVDNIICAEGKDLMFKHHNASPACVNSQSIEKLKHRGWQIEKPAIACTMEYNPMCGMDGVTYGNPCMLRSEHMALKQQGECPASTITMTQLEKAQDMVSSAIMLYDEIGTKAFDQFDNNPKFHDGELYVYVVRVDDGQIMAHGVDKSIIGKNNYDILDADGVNLGELIINGATQNGAWIDYKYKDPVNQEILPKEAWVIKHDDFVFGSGIYLQEN